MSTLSLETLNPKIINMEYAVRGRLVLRAQEHQKALQEGKPRPFKDVIFCNIGNPQSVGQVPLTFVRQVLSLCMYPSLISDPTTRSLFPPDAVARAQYLLSKDANLGAYSESKGLEVVRQSVVKFLKERDGYDSDVDNIFLTNGASQGVKTILSLLIRNVNDGILVPIPQYPLYSATIVQLGGTMIGYQLDENNDWSLSPEDLIKQVEESKKKGIQVRALVLINPGNPTGQVLRRDTVEWVVEFCEKNGIVLMADEVYQANVYGKNPFISCKKVVRDMKSTLDLVSFHSVSKGVLGECGMRGGYMELVNIKEEVCNQVYKVVSVELCSNIVGQVATEIMVNPPKPGDASYPLWRQEYDGIFESLKLKAHILAQGLNSLRGVTCNDSQGAMYAFPQIRLNKSAIVAAEKEKLPPDTFYCLALLDATGICVVPGSGFGQEAGTYHFRTTFLPPTQKIEDALERMSKFHEKFMTDYP